MKIFKWIIIFSLFLIVLQGCISINDRDTATKEFSNSINTSSSPSIYVKNSRGMVFVKGWDKNEVEVNYTIVGKGSTEKKARKNIELFDVRIEEKGDLINVIVDQPKVKGFIRLSKGYVKLKINAPFKTKVEVDTSSADCYAQDLRNSITVDTSSGDVSMKNIEGSIKVDTSSGDIKAASIEGNLDIDTSSGDVRIHKAELKNLFIETSSGDSDIIDTTFEHYKGKASSGDVLLKGMLRSEGEIEIRTSSGDVTINLQKSLQSSVEFHTSSGDMTVRYEKDKYERKRRSIFCEIGSPDSSINISTSSGDIVLKPHKSSEK